MAFSFHDALSVNKEDQVDSSGLYYLLWGVEVEADIGGTVAGYCRHY